MIFQKEKTSPKSRIGILMGEKTNPFWEEMERHYHLIAPVLGLEIECFWPSEMDEEAQLQKLFEMIPLKFDLVIINPMNYQNLIPGIWKANKSGIWILDVGAKTDQKLVEDAKPYYVPFKTLDFYQQGCLGARYIVDRLGSGGVNKKVAIIEGRKGATQSIGRSQGAADTFGQFAFIKLVKRAAADFDRSKAKGLAEKILYEEPEIKAFFCANDTMALGVVEAVDRLGKLDEIIVVGVDLIQEAADSIRQGRLAASVAFSTAQVAQKVLEAVPRILEKGEVVNEFCVESILVTRENISLYPLFLEKNRNETRKGGAQ